MKPRTLQSRCRRKLFHGVIAILFLGLLSPVHSQTPAQQAESQAMTTTSPAPKIPNDQLHSLVAPIALYPDQLLSQTLVASTYPLEVIQLQQWREKNKNLKGTALSDAVEKQNWDPSIQAMAAFPDVVQRLADNIQWTTDLGNAFLAQESDVMDAVQSMRAKAQSKGTLKATAQQKVETQTVGGGKQVIVVQQANPEVVYVPSYDPTVVYGPPGYPYPPIAYPPPGYYAAGAAIAFGTGVALGAAWGGSWGWNCGWGHGNVNVNVNNKYVNNYNKNVNKNFNQANFNKANINSGKWQHNPQHRGGAPYNRASASQVQGQLAARGQSGAGGGNRPGGGGAGQANRPGGGANRPGGGGGGQANRPGGGANRPGGGGAVERTGGGNRPGGGGSGERLGGRNVSGGGGSGRGGAFGGGSGFGGGSARASSMRGAHSMGGGGFSGGGRSGGGRRR